MANEVESSQPLEQAHEMGWDKLRDWDDSTSLAIDGSG